LEALYARLDRLGQDRVEIDSFEDLFVPRECLYADLLARRGTATRRKRMSMETKRLVNGMLRKLLDSEHAVEELKRRLYERPNFHHGLIFEFMD
jgi:hypothetical protein